MKNIYDLDTYQLAFCAMNNQAMSLESKARKALSEGNPDAARDWINEAYRTIATYEVSDLGTPEATSGIRNRIFRTEQLI